MADLGTMTSDPAVADNGSGRPGRRIRRVRGLPGGRAVVGAFLVAASAVGVFAAFLTATAAPDTRYAVATADIDIGTRLTEADVAELFEMVPVDLPEAVAGRAVREVQLPQLAGQLVTSPVREGDLLQASAVVEDAGVPDTETLSFSLSAADAVGGTLEPGERIDVLATYGSGGDAWTAFVVRGILLVDSSAAGGGVGTSDDVTLTVAVSDLRDVQALGHAVRTSDVFVTRSTVSEGSTESAPDAYMPSPDDQGPAPDPATDPLGSAQPGAPTDGDGEG